MKIIVFKPTHQCNLNCPFCYDREKRQKSTDIMPVDKAIFALQKAMDTADERSKKTGTFKVCWHGGEPTLVGSEYIDKVCSHDYGYQIKWVMQSNMSTLNKELADIIKKHHIELGGSWDGLAQSNKNYHHTDYLKKSVEYLGYAHLLYVVTPENCTDVIPSFLYCYSNNYQVQFNPIFGEDTSVQDYEKMAYEMVKLFDLETQLPNIKITRPFDDLLTDIDGRPVNYCEEIFCVGQWLCIEYDGTVINCGHPWPEDMQYGNIFDENFRVDKLPETPGYKKMQANIFAQLEHCKNCKWLITCKNRCPFSCIDPETHDFLFNEGVCRFRTIVSEGVYNIIKTRASNNTLYNKEIIDAIHHTAKREFFPWRYYKSPII